MKPAIDEPTGSHKKNPTKYMDRPLSTWRRDMDAYVRKLQDANERVRRLEGQLRKHHGDESMICLVCGHSQKLRVEAQ